MEPKEKQSFSSQFQSSFMIEIVRNRLSVIYRLPASLHSFFFFFPSMETNSRREDGFNRFRPPIFFNFPPVRGILCNFSGSWRSSIGIIAVSVCRSIAGGWLKIGGRGLSPFVEILFEPSGEWESQRFRETMNGDEGGVNISRGRNNAQNEGGGGGSIYKGFTVAINWNLARANLAKDSLGVTIFYNANG